MVVGILGIRMKPPATTTMILQPLRRCLYRRHNSIISGQSRRSISSSSTKKSDSLTLRAVATSWELNGSSIIANKGTEPFTRNPSLRELKNLFATSALPMVGFGFMDNFIMIQAGGYIDSTLGVKFGLATLTAAAMGQVVSDVSGVLFGSTVDSAMTHVGLLKPLNISASQLRLPLSRRVSLAGAVVGVIVGCCLGATSLYFVPHHHHSEAKQKLEKIKAILSDMLLANDIEYDNCDVYLDESQLLPSNGHHIFFNEPEILPSSGHAKIQLRAMTKFEPTALYQQCLRDGVTIISNNSGDNTLLRAPIYGKKDTLLGVIEFSVNRPYNPPAYGEREEQLARVTARHIGIVLEQCL